MLWWSASFPSAPAGGSMEAQWGKKRTICVCNCGHLCMRVSIVSGTQDFKSFHRSCRYSATLCVTGAAGMDERERKQRHQGQLLRARVTHFRGESEKRERWTRDKRWRKTPVFLPGGGGNSEPGCHVDICLHLHLSSPW